MHPSGPSGFAADPELLRRLGATFAEQANQLEATSPRFEQDATQVEQAFGLLGPSNELYFEYLELARSTVSGLHQLEEALQRLGQGLHIAAHSYEESDVASSVPNVFSTGMTGNG